MKQISFKRSNACAICHSPAHKGYLCAQAVKEHQCLGKACPYFEKLEHPYWVQVERKRLEERAFKRLSFKCKKAPIRDIWKAIKELHIDELRKFVEVCND